jgi:hypothetical protein
VSGTFQTTYWTDDGTKTALNALPTPTFGLFGPPATPSRLLAADPGSSEYTTFPLSVDANQSFRVDGVPAGPYFIELDKTMTYAATCGVASTTVIDVVVAQLFESSASTPDLQLVSSGRRDLATAASPDTQLSLDITNMDPWASGDRIQIASSQALVNQPAFFVAQPTIGATSFSGTSAWISEGVPDASKGDVVFVYHRATTSFATPAGTSAFHRATKFARLTDLTIVDGSTASATVPLVAAAQTGALSTDIRSSQFAALAGDINPGATFTAFGVVILGVPHSVAYPDMPVQTFTPVAFLQSTDGTSDVNGGTFPYGQFLDTFWKEVRRVFYSFDVSSVGATAVLQSDVPAQGATSVPITPALGPPKSPRVNGNDAFVSQTSVGLQPTISWSPPALGDATSYLVEVIATALPCDAGGQIAGVSALVRTGRSFKVPPGILRSGIGYRATITARQAPWDTADAGPFRTGTPLHTAQAVTAQFVP